MLIRRFAMAVGIFFACACQPKEVNLDGVRQQAGAAREKAERDRITRDVETAIRSKDFNKLSAMQKEFATSRERSGSGTWKLEIYHASVQFHLGDGLVKERACQYNKKDFVDSWAAADPTNPAPIITQAQLLTNQAWCHRGVAPAASVPPDDWAKFADGLTIANQVLETNKKIASIDPEFYAVKAMLYRGLAVSPQDFDALINEATQREPDYYRTYFNAIWRFAPQWGGSYEQMEQFARFAAQKSKDGEGASLYARLFWVMEGCNCDILQKVADWPLLRRSMRDAYVRYPVGWNGDQFIKMACLMNQPEEASLYVKAAYPGMEPSQVQGWVASTCAAAVARS